MCVTAPSGNLKPESGAAFRRGPPAGPQPRPGNAQFPFPLPVTSRFDRELKTVSGRESPFPDSAAGNPDREIPVSRLGRETGNSSPGRRAGDFLVWHCLSPALTRKPELRILHCGTAPGRAGASHHGTWPGRLSVGVQAGRWSICHGPSPSLQARGSESRALGRLAGARRPLGRALARAASQRPSTPGRGSAPRLAAGVLIEVRLIKLSCQA
jgi:hypothetical protein